MKRLAACVAVGWAACLSAWGQGSAPDPFAYFGEMAYDARIPTPKSHLGYEVGQRFTRHSDLISYMRAVDEASSRVVMREYGRTHQRRPLVVMTISAPENLARLDAILRANRELADPATPQARAREIIQSNPAIAWFSAGVHGNEPSPSEAAVQTVYALAASSAEEIKRILKDVVIVVDPLLNPDGHERYVAFYDNASGEEAIEATDAAEHQEPWPGGRTNHYLFDLNRDWLWLVHPESRARLAVYREYLPQLHIDQHEQEYRNPFFLGAGDDPYNTNIPKETREWIERYGEANARAFDKHSLMYATKERFDYLYPGYGKVLPTYHGAIGMLAEKAGHGRAGLAITVNEAYTLTLRDRARDHYILTMSNLEMTAANRQAQLERFRQFFVQAAASTAEPRAFVVSATNDRDVLARAFDILSSHGVRIEETTREASLKGARALHQPKGPPDDVTLPAGTWVIRTDQPLGALVRAVFEPAPRITSVETYDITAWSMPLAFGLAAYQSDGVPEAPTRPLTSFAAAPGAVTGQGDLALIVRADQARFPRALAILSEAKAIGRIASEDFTIDSVAFPSGSFIAHGFMTPDLGALAEKLTAAGLSIHRTGGALTTDGPVLSAVGNASFVPARILLVRGDGIDANSYGEHWHLLDVELDAPYTPVNSGDLARTDLSKYNVIVVPDGSVPDGALEPIKAWVRRGGVLVASAGASTWASTRVLDLKAPETPREEDRTPDSDRSYQARRDARQGERVPGSLMLADVDVTHPIAAGVGPWVAVLKNGVSTPYIADSGYAVARFAPEPFLGGVASEKNLKALSRKPAMTHHRLGSGSVFCLSDDANVRGFTVGPRRLLENAILLGPSVGGQ